MNYDWVTTEMFQEKLEEIVGKMTTAELFALPGFQEAVQEELNNKVLEALEEDHGCPVCENCGESNLPTAIQCEYCLGELH